MTLGKQLVGVSLHQLLQTAQALRYRLIWLRSCGAPMEELELVRRALALADALVEAELDFETETFLSRGEAARAA